MIEEKRALFFRDLRQILENLKAENPDIERFDLLELADEVEGYIDDLESDLMDAKEEAEEAFDEARIAEGDLEDVRVDLLSAEGEAEQLREDLERAENEIGALKDEISDLEAALE